jgi:hypothetical protein
VENSFVISRDAPVLILPDIQPAAFPANLIAGYWISVACHIPDIRMDFLINIQISIEIGNKQKHQMF